MHGVIGHGAKISGDFLQIRIGGDMALFQGLGELLVDAEDIAPQLIWIERSSMPTPPDSTTGSITSAPSTSASYWRHPASVLNNAIKSEPSPA